LGAGENGVCLLVLRRRWRLVMVIGNG
jgi:hypothetical protein